ncbi:MAG: ribosome hibernation-promoting factor, HPF/YfiA family [Armatimonadota bacterium]|jgi:putative sigma-54 modulation protein
MRIDVRSKDGSVPQYFLDHAEPRLESLTQYLTRLQEVRVVLREKRGLFTVEITAEEPRNVFRSEKSSGDVLNAFDDAYEAIEKQARRHKRRMNDRTRQSVRQLEPVQAVETPPDNGDNQPDGAIPEPDIIRVKTHAVKPMAPEEAAMQMEMVGHDFYVFTDARTDNVAVVYRRKSGGYGLIEPEVQ